MSKSNDMHYDLFPFPNGESSDKDTLNQLEALSIRVNEYFPTPEIPPPAAAHDTCEISAIYLQRHKHQAHISLGRWFSLAHSLVDKELDNAVTALEAKRIIVRKGYNRLSLEPLNLYNSGIGRGE
jgi:hypothetical protein